MDNRRRWYGFNDLELVKQHISEVKTYSDIIQLNRDVILSGANLIEFQFLKRGVYSLEYAGEYRHIFMDAEAYNKYGGIKPEEGDCLTIITEND